MTRRNDVWELVAPVSKREEAGDSAALRSLADGMRLAFLANGKPNAEKLHRRVAGHLLDRYGERLEIAQYGKSNMALAAPTDIVRSIAQTSNIVVVGSGD
jgi:hypothetical protein